MRVLAIDPGPTESAWVIWDGKAILAKGKALNAHVADVITVGKYSVEHTCIEMIASYGMAVGAEVFETCVWIGRFMSCLPNPDLVERMPRRVVKLHLCNSARANDGNVRTALLDRFGGKDAAIGKKAAPGPLYGVSGDIWAALAVAITWMDTQALSGGASNGN